MVPRRQITFTRARPANKNDGCYVEQKNWAVVRTVVGYHRYDTAAELLLLNEIWQLQSKRTNYFCPQQKLVSKVRCRRHGVQETRHRRHPVPSRDRSPNHDRGAHSGADPDLLPDHPAATQRQIQALTAQLLTITTSKAGPTAKAQVPKRARFT